MADNVSVPNVEAKSFFVVLDIKNGGYSGPGDLPDIYTWKIIDEKDIASYFSIDVANSKVSRKVVLATEVTVDQIESILKEKKKKDLLAKQEQLRQEMIAAGMIPPDEPKPRPPFQPPMANEGVRAPEVPQPIKEENKPIEKVTVDGQEAVVFDAGTIIKPTPPPKYPLNPETRKPYTELEFETVYANFKQMAEQNENVICVDKGPGVFILRTNERMNVGKYFGGVPIVVQGMRHR